MCLLKCLKGLVLENRSTVSILNSLKNCTTEVPSYFFITLAKTDLENVRLSVSEIPGVFVKTLTGHDKYYLRSRNNLQQPIQLQLSTKQKVFLNFLLHI